MSVYEAVRILLVSAQESLRDEVACILQARLPNHQLRWVAHPDLVLGRLADLMPHLVLVDDELPDMSPEAFVRKLAPSAQGVAILVLTDPSALPPIRGVMLAGAQGFLLKRDQNTLVHTVHGCYSPPTPTADPPFFRPCSSFLPPEWHGCPLAEHALR